MDCCTSGKMNKTTFWIIVGIAIAILLALVIWQTVKISGLSSAGNAATTAVKAASSSGMVGGC